MEETSIAEQVKDDPELLELMMKDHNSASKLYKATNFWASQIPKFLLELQSLGLRDMRRRRNSMLRICAAIDLFPFSDPLGNSANGIAVRILQSFYKMSLKVKKTKIFQVHESGVYSTEKYHDINISSYELAKSYGEKNGAKSIDEFEASYIGNPENAFHVNGKMYTISLLGYYVQYAYCCKYMNFDLIDTMTEIGSGAGKQIEVIKKLHPHLCFYVFDIPPSLYVCEQYLSALFPDSVISYRQTRTLKRVPENSKGKIFIFGNWKIPELTNFKYDLFWNSFSFAEMEPDVVLNYLKYVNQQATKYVYLHNRMKGMNLRIANSLGGVIEKTLFEHYRRGLEDFELQDLSKAVHLPVTLLRTFKFCFWRKK